MISDSHSLGLASGFTSEVGAFTDAVVSALGRRNSSTGIGDCVGGGGVSSGCTGRGMWLFLRCSGVESTDEGGDEGASVGEDVSDPDGMFSGSNSRSGSEGSSRGRRVIRSSTSRSSALENGPVMPYFRGLRYVLYGFENDNAPPTGAS